MYYFESGVFEDGPMNSPIEQDVILKLQEYLKNYRERVGINQIKMSEKLDLSLSRYQNIEQKGAAGRYTFEFATFLKIALLEYSSINEFVFSELSSGEDLEKFAIPNHLISKIKKRASEHTPTVLIPDIVEWMIELALIIAEGDSQQLIDAEANVLTYYSSQHSIPEETKRKIKDRLIMLFQNR